MRSEICSKCGVKLTVIRPKDAWCGDCAKKIAKAYYEKNRASILSKGKDYYEAHKETMKEKARENHYQNRERNNNRRKKHWYDNREYYRQAGKEYRLNNREKLDAYAKEYRLKNAKEINEKIKKYSKTEKGKGNQHRKRLNRRLKIQHLPKDIKRHSVNEWLNLVDSCGGECSCCGIQCSTLDCYAPDYLTKDHIVPISKGGHDGIDNLQVLCRRCNASKGNRFTKKYEKEERNKGSLPSTVEPSEEVPVEPA